VSVIVPSAALAATVSGTFKGPTSQGKIVVIHVVHGVVTRPSKLTSSMPRRHGTSAG
jgi:hypothetical protein